MQPAYGALSSEHSNCEPGSDEANLKIAPVGNTSPACRAASVERGATVSTVKALVAGVESTPPAASFARTSKLCGTLGESVVASYVDENGFA